jgi:hypothetical protein
MCFAPDKKNVITHFRIRGTLVFFCPYKHMSERERERERERE